MDVDRRDWATHLPSGLGVDSSLDDMSSMNSPSDMYSVIVSILCLNKKLFFNKNLTTPALPVDTDSIAVQIPDVASTG